MARRGVGWDARLRRPGDPVLEALQLGGNPPSRARVYQRLRGVAIRVAIVEQVACLGHRIEVAILITDHLCLGHPASFGATRANQKETKDRSREELAQAGSRF